MPLHHRKIERLQLRYENLTKMLYDKLKGYFAFQGVIDLNTLDPTPEVSSLLANLLDHKITPEDPERGVQFCAAGD